MLAAVLLVLEVGAMMILHGIVQHNVPLAP
jgi:hypothetical protein